MWTLVGICLLQLSGAAGTATPSSAAPASCADGGRNERAHETGRRQGGSMVDSAWASVQRDCRERARVERTVRDALARRAPPADASDTLKCRDSGFKAGAHEALARIAAACSDR